MLATLRRRVLACLLGSALAGLAVPAAQAQPAAQLDLAYQSELRAENEALMAALRETAAAGNDAGPIEAAVQALAKGTEAFAARRMNEGIRRALAGKNLESI